jgi:hypothetical protein
MWYPRSGNLYRDFGFYFPNGHKNPPPQQPTTRAVYENSSGHGVGPEVQRPGLRNYFHFSQRGLSGSLADLGRYGGGA